VNTRKPDLILALIVGEVCVAASAWQAATYQRTGGGARLYPEAAYIVLAYVLFESIRCARPAVGALTGAFGLATVVVPRAVGSLAEVRGLRAASEVVVGFAALLALGAVLGLVVSTIAWLFRRRRDQQVTAPAPAAGPRLGGWLLVLVLLLAVAPAVESFGWAFEGDFRQGFNFALEASKMWPGWGVFYRLDRTLTVALASVAAYALLRRRRWARGMTASYLAVGLVVALTRVWFYHLLVLENAAWNEGALAVPGREFQYVNLFVLTPVMSFEGLVRANLIEVAVRAALCAVVIPYLYLSRRAKDAFARRGVPVA
jgi:hypothetical protein